jgi:hypothetical protein
MTGRGEDPAAASWSLDLRGTQPAALAHVRRWAGRMLVDVSDECLADLLLVATAIFANAYDHGDGDGRSG